MAIRSRSVRRVKPWLKRSSIRIWCCTRYHSCGRQVRDTSFYKCNLRRLYELRLTILSRWWISNRSSVSRDSIYDYSLRVIWRAILIRIFCSTGQDLPLKSNPSEGGCREYPGDAPLSFTSDLWEPTFWCYQRDGKPQSYWMVSVVSYSPPQIWSTPTTADHDRQRTNCKTTNNQVGCTDLNWKRFHVPKGWTTIDGKNWGGLQKFDLYRRWGYS